MLRFLFPGLTAAPHRGAALFDALVREARRPDWYREGGVANSVDGRFAMLATVVALATVRLEQAGEGADQLSVALAERFIEAMDSEHREMGVGDPALGKKVRKLVAGLARRVDLWREAVVGSRPWDDAIRASLFGEATPRTGSDAQLVRLSRELWARFDSSDVEQLSRGRIG